MGNVDVGTLSVQSTMSSMSHSNKKQNKRKRKRLRQEFESLPAPNFEYNVRLPALPSKPFKSNRLVIEDAADCDARKLVEAEFKNEQIAKKQSSVIRRNFPRPNTVNPCIQDCVLSDRDYEIAS